MKVLQQKVIPVTNQSSQDQNRLYSVIGGHIYFQTLATAIRLKFFDLFTFESSLSFEKLKEKLNLEHRPLRILLLGLASLGFITKDRDEKYILSEIAKEYFCSSSPSYLGNVVLWQHHINYKPMFHMFEAIKTNSNSGLEEVPGTEATLYERLAKKPDMEKIFQNAMQEISSQAVADFVEKLDLSSIKFLVDVGGGNGSNLIRLAKKNPHLNGGVFDSPTVVRIAEQNIINQHFQDRLTTFPGDCFNTPFPNSADAILFCHFFTIWSEEKNKFLIQKSFDHLPKNGKLILFNMIQWDSQDGPLSSSMGSPYFLTLATGEGMIYTTQEYMDWMQEAGFKTIEKIALPTDHVALVGTK